MPGRNRAGRGERRRPRRRAERPRRGTLHEPSGGRRACRGSRRWRSRACRARRAWTCRSRGGVSARRQGRVGLKRMRGGARRPSSSRAGKVARTARNASVSFDRPFRRESFGRPNCMARRGLWAAPGAARRAPKVFRNNNVPSWCPPRPDRPRAPSKTLVAMASTSAHRLRAHSLPASARLEHELRGGIKAIPGVRLFLRARRRARCPPRESIASSQVCTSSRRHSSLTFPSSFPLSIVAGHRVRPHARGKLRRAGEIGKILVDELAGVLKVIYGIRAMRQHEAPSRRGEGRLARHGRVHRARRPLRRRTRAVMDIYLPPAFP